MIRLQELRSWAASGQYQSILDGAYVRRGAETGSAGSDVREGFEHYASSLEHSDDPIVKTVKNVGESIGKAAEGLRDSLKDRFKSK